MHNNLLFLKHFIKKMSDKSDFLKRYNQLGSKLIDEQLLSSYVCEGGIGLGDTNSGLKKEATPEDKEKEFSGNVMKAKEELAK